MNQNIVNATVAFIVYMVLAASVLACCAESCSAQDVVIVDALVTLDCAATPFDTQECIMREGGIVVAECDIAHSGQVVCVEVYAD